MRFRLHEMAVGDSIGVGPEEGKALANAAFNYKRRTPGWNYTRRTLDEGHVRIWCTGVPGGNGAQLPPPLPPRPARAATERTREAESAAENPVAAKLRQIAGKTKPSVHHHGSR